MEKRYEGFLAPHGLYVLDTQTGDVRFIAHTGDALQIEKPSIAGASTYHTKQIDNSTQLNTHYYIFLHIFQFHICRHYNK